MTINIIDRIKLNSRINLVKTFIHIIIQLLISHSKTRINKVFVH
jgi:hypothetical protein